MTEIAKGIIPIKTIEAGGETAQYVWNTTTDTGAGAGLHITTIPEDDFLADPDNGGYNALMQMSALLFRLGLVTRAKYGADETIMTTPQGAEAFRISTGSGTSIENFEINIHRSFNSMGPEEVTVEELTTISTGDTITLIFIINRNNVAHEYTTSFIKGTTEQKIIPVTGGYIITINYIDETAKFIITTDIPTTSSCWLEYIRYQKTTDTPEIAIRGLTLTDGNRYVESRLNMWENGSPTSTFTARTVSLAELEDEFDAVEIYYRHSTTDDRIYCLKAEVGTRTPLTVQGLEYNRTGGRLATVNSNGITFGAASYNTNSNNTYAIPVKIIGIKYI